MSKLERVAGIEPASSAWKAEIITDIPYPHGGGRWIRTTETFVADLQSAPFDRSGTPPDYSKIRNNPPKQGGSHYINKLLNCKR